MKRQDVKVGAMVWVWIRARYSLGALELGEAKWRQPGVITETGEGSDVTVRVLLPDPLPWEPREVAVGTEDLEIRMLGYMGFDASEDEPHGTFVVEL